MTSGGRRAAMAVVLALAALGLTGCGSGVEDAGPASTTTTLTETQERLAGEFATAAQRLLRVRQLPGITAEQQACAGREVVAAVGLDRFDEAQLTPSELTEVRSLDDGGIELSEDEIGDLGVALAACLPPGIGARFVEATGLPADGSFRDCLAEAVLDALGGGLARQVAHGPQPLDTVGFAEGQVAGVRCRWKNQPEGPTSGTTLADGAEALETALADELATPPSGLDAPALETEDLDCFVPDVIDTLASGLDGSDATARELARYLTGEGPEAIGVEVTHAQAASMARSYLDCVTEEAILRAQLEFAGAPDDVLDDLLACLQEELPEGSLLDNATLNFELGVAGQGTPEGQEILQAQAEAGRACALAAQDGDGTTTS